ncbi:hypothetical protein K435DRAFT_852185 [Dendrothele bispora CBS 962.96]|uniref:Uncharacterized protein n=1 Tax=Dendrothele bispora (strain CBS 962.96) TaxID=1314807 RepID=A0A4V4HHL3_DENBC|nr:hypothetical protein K435DRAFT_852185 [Dendrothele bispora CBS 962.96]
MSRQPQLHAQPCLQLCHASSRMWNNHVIAPFFPFDHHLRVPMPRGTTCNRSVGNVARCNVLDALGGAYRVCGAFTFALITIPPTSDGLILDTHTQNRVRQQAEVQEQPQQSTRTLWK